MLEEFYSYLEHELQAIVHKQLHFRVIQSMYNPHNKPLYSGIVLGRILINSSLRPMALFYIVRFVSYEKNRRGHFHKRTDPVASLEVEARVATSYQSVLAICRFQTARAIQIHY